MDENAQNLKPEELARVKIDEMLRRSGWVKQAFFEFDAMEKGMQGKYLPAKAV